MALKWTKLLFLRWPKVHTIARISIARNRISSTRSYFAYKNMASAPIVLAPAHRQFPESEQLIVVCFECLEYATRRLLCGNGDGGGGGGANIIIIHMHARNALRFVGQTARSQLLLFVQFIGYLDADAFCVRNFIWFISIERSAQQTHSECCLIIFLAAKCK